MKKNFYLIEAYILGHMATFIFSKYFLLIHSDFNDVIYKFYENIHEIIRREIILLGIIRKKIKKGKNMLADYHIHCKYSDDSEEKPEKIIKI